MTGFSPLANSQFARSFFRQMTWSGRELPLAAGGYVIEGSECKSRIL